MMQLPRLLLLTLLTCCVFYIVHHGSNSLQLPRFDGISETFSSLLRKVRSTSGEEVKLEDDKAQSRSKRQTTNIRDESPHPYEIRTSRLKAVFCLIYTVGHKKRASFIFRITLANVDRFYSFTVAVSNELQSQTL